MPDTIFSYLLHLKQKLFMNSRRWKMSSENKHIPVGDGLDIGDCLQSRGKSKS